MPASTSERPRSLESTGLSRFLALRTVVTGLATRARLATTLGGTSGLPSESGKVTNVHRDLTSRGVIAVAPTCASSDAASGSSSCARSLVPTTAYVLSARQPARVPGVRRRVPQLAGPRGRAHRDPARVRRRGSARRHAGEARPGAARRAERRSSSAGVKGMTPGGLLGSASVVPVERDEHPHLHASRTTTPRRRSELATAYAKAFTTYRGELDSQAVRTARRRSQRKLTQLEANGEGRSAARGQPALEGPAARDAPGAADVADVRDPHRRRRRARSPRRRGGTRMLGLMLGLVLGLGLAFVVEALDTRVRSATEVGERLGLPAARPRPAAAEGAREGRPARDDRAADRHERRGVPHAAHEPRLRDARERRRPHDPRHERRRAGGEVDDRGQPRDRRGTVGAPRRARRPRPAPSPTSTASSGSCTQRASPTSRSGTSRSSRR